MSTLAKKVRRLEDLCRGSSFYGLSEEEVKTHIAIKGYGKFVLTEAVIPSYDLQVKPKTGFRRDSHYDETGCRNASLRISASKEILLDLFYDLVRLLGPIVAVTLESSHEDCDPKYSTANDMDLTVALSALAGFEDILLNDGFTGITVTGDLEDRGIVQVQFDEHKHLSVYGWTKIREEVMPVLYEYGIAEDDDLMLIVEGEHIHSSTDEYRSRFQGLQALIGAR